MRAARFDCVHVGRYLLLMSLGEEPGDQAVGADPLERYLFERSLAEALRRLQINCVLDVGANQGQYGLMLRQLGYSGYIVSFEPAQEAFEALRVVSSRDAKWTAHQFALGAESARTPIHVTAGTAFSSFLRPTAYAVERFRASAPVQRVEEVEMRRLDGILRSVVAHVEQPRLFLKIDTQGYDLEVFSGAGDEIHRVLGLQSEVAVVPLYEGIPTMLGALHVYMSQGFELSGLCPVSRDPGTARVLEYDCLMVRPEATMGPESGSFTRVGASAGLPV
jgi:FkbM family methyltransferase